jgi:Polyketide cyclase / dehydrase and lipid transport
MDALADVEALLSHTPPYRRVEVLDRYDDGRPHRVRLAVRVLGRLDEEILEFRWGPDWLVWDAEQTKQQHPSVEYRLRPDLIGTSTTVTVDVTVEPDSLIAVYFIKRVGKAIIDAANEGLRQQIQRGKASDQA